MSQASRPEWADKLSLDAIRKAIVGSFAFLVAEHGFQAPVDCGISSIVIGLRYRAKRLAIEVMADRKDAFVETLVVLLDAETGERPEGYHFDSMGRPFVVRMSHEGFWQRGYRPPRDGLDSATLAPDEDLKRRLETEAEVLRKVFPEFLRDDPGYFAVMRLRREAELARAAEKAFFTQAEKLFEAKDFAGFVKHLEVPAYPLGRVWQARLEYARKKLG